MNWASVVAPSDAANYASVAASTGAVNYASVAASTGAVNRVSTAACPDAANYASAAALSACCSADFAAGQDTDKLFYSEQLLLRKESRPETLLK